MLKAIMKRFDSKPKEELMNPPVDQPSMATPDLAATLASTLEAMASQAEALQAVTESLSEFKAKYEVAQTALDAVEAAKAALVADAKAVRLQTRKDAVVVAVGAGKADALLLATDSLDDASFNAVIAAMTVNLAIEAKTTLFTEVGVSAPSAAPEAAQESAEATLLKAKYQTKKGTK